MLSIYKDVGQKLSRGAKAWCVAINAEKARGRRRLRSGLGRESWGTSSRELGTGNDISEWPKDLTLPQKQDTEPIGPSWTLISLRLRMEFSKVIRGFCL